MSRYYDDDNDDDPYAPRIGPAAMPSPRSKFAPYFSGCTDTLEDFLEEYEGLAYDCALTDAQRVDVLIRYVVPSLRDFWRSLDGFRSHNWPRFRQSLINVFGSTTPRPQVMRQRLLNYVQDSSRARMDCEDDVLQYYRQFLRYSAPLVHTGHLSEEERDAAFWYGFHPLDREVLQPRLLGKNPFQPPDIPFHFEDVFGCARAAFAYEDYLPSPWSHAKQFKPPIVRREQPVVEPIPRDAYSFRAVMCAIASNAETTTTPNDFPLPSHSTPDPQLPSSSSPSALESQHGLVHSVTLDQPEPAYMLPPSDSHLSHISTLVHSATDSDPVFASTPPSVSSMLLPSVFPTPSHASSLARLATDNDPIFMSTPPSSSVSSTFLTSASPTLSHSSSHLLAPSAAADVPEISCTHSWSSTTPTPTTLISSDFEYLPSATVDQPAPTLLSTPPSPSSISSVFFPSPACLAAEDQPEPESSSTPPIALSSLIHPLTHLPSSPSTDNVPEFAAAPTSSPSISSTFLSSPVRLEMNNQPESEHEAASTSSMSVPLSSLPLSTSKPAFSETNSQSVRSTLVSSPSHDHFPVSPSSPSTSEVSRSPETSTLDSLPLTPPPDQSSSLSRSLGQSSKPHESESFSLSAADVVTLSHSESSLSSLGETIPLLLAQHEASVTVPTPHHSTPPQRPPRLKTVGSDSSLLGVTLAPASDSPTPFVPRLQELPTVHEAPLTLVPHLPLASPPLLLSRSGLVYFNFALALVSTVALVSTLLNISNTLSTFARKLWSNNQDTGNSQNSTPDHKTGDDFTQ